VYVYLGINTVKSIIVLLTDANMILKPDKVKRLHGIALMKSILVIVHNVELLVI
jgi:hypothetical protein